jgi:hypothetical protein
MQSAGSNTKKTTHLKMPTKMDGSKDNRYTMPQFTKKDSSKDKRTISTNNKK